MVRSYQHSRKTSKRLCVNFMQVLSESHEPINVSNWNNHIADWFSVPVRPSICPVSFFFLHPTWVRMMTVLSWVGFATAVERLLRDAPTELGYNVFRDVIMADQAKRIKSLFEDSRPQYKALSFYTRPLKLIQLTTILDPDDEKYSASMHLVSIFANLNWMIAGLALLTSISFATTKECLVGWPV